MYDCMVEMVINYSSVKLDVNSKNSIDATPLHVAALNNAEARTMLLKYDADVNSTSNLGYTPMQYAARHGWYKACKLVSILKRLSFKGGPVYYINENLNINWQNRYNEIALRLIIDSRNAAIMQSKRK